MTAAAAESQLARWSGARLVATVNGREKAQLATVARVGNAAFHGVRVRDRDGRPALDDNGDRDGSGGVVAASLPRPRKSDITFLVKASRAMDDPAPGSEQAPSGRGAVVAEGLTKRFGERTACQDVTFSVDHGEVFGFLGPNGAGKTTTVRTLGTLLTPTSGTASVAGLPLTPANGVQIRQRISIMPESPGLYLRLTVAENLQYFADLYELSDSRARIERALRAVNLLDRADDPCRSLSKGLRQRVGLARALLSDPQVLFLDEPTSGLDPVAAREVHELIDSLRKRGVTIFLTTHRLAEAERLCDRVGIMNTTLRMVGRPDELREQLFSKSIEVKTREPLAEPQRVFTGLPGVDGWHQSDDGTYVLAVSDTELAAPEAARALVATGADLLSLSPSRRSLEDVYLQLIDTDVEALKR